MTNHEGVQNNVTIICMQYPPEKGAAPSRLAKMAVGLRARNIDVNVITALPNYPTGRIFPGYRHKLTHSESIDGIQIKRYWLYPSNSKQVLKRILNMISFSATVFLSLPHLMKTRPDTMIFNSPPLTLGLSSLILAKLLRARAIANISDIWPMSALALGAMRKGWLYNTLENVEHYIYRRSDAVMAQSKETQQHILDRLPEKITFLYRNLDYPSDFIDTYPTLQLQSVKIVYAGLFGVAQGVYDICKSIDFKRLGVEFHLYGDGPEKEAIVKYVTENPACNIFVHDAVPKSEISEILSKYHATIVPLITHIKGAFPSKLYMALSASLPVFYCGAGEGAQFVRDMNIGWVSEPGDYENLANQIKDLTSMPDADYRRLRSHISDLATNTFNFNDQLDRLVNFIVNE